MSFDGLPRSPSYYDLLGVPADVDAAALKKAFRAAAFEHHPDRGGSHARMVELNAAYQVLSDSASRAAYDAWLAAGQSPAADDEARKQTQEARQRAEEYPSEWADFVEWLDRAGEAVAEDWKNAELKAAAEPTYHGMYFPDPGDSCSGQLAVGAGAVVGIAVGLGWVAEIGFWGLPIVVVPTWVGAWAGILMHKAIGFFAVEVQEERRRADEHAAEENGEEPPTTPLPPSTQELPDGEPAVDSEGSVESESPGLVTALVTVGRTLEAAIHLNYRLADSVVSLLYFRLPTEQNRAERESTQEPYPDGCIIPFMIVNTMGVLLLGLALLEGC